MRNAQPSEGDDGEVVQAFVGDTLDEAMAAAVTALGPELVVRRARKVRTGLSGLLGKDRYEVLALPDPEAAGDPAYAVESALEALLDRADALESGGSYEQSAPPAPLPPAPAPSRRRPALDLAPAPRSSEDAVAGRAGVRRARSTHLSGESAHPDPDLADHAPTDAALEPAARDAAAARPSLPPGEAEQFPKNAAAREAARREVAREARQAQAAEQRAQEERAEFARLQDEQAQRARQDQADQEARERELRQAAEQQEAQRRAAAERRREQAALESEPPRPAGRAASNGTRRPNAARRAPEATESLTAASEQPEAQGSALARRATRRHGWSVAALGRLGVPSPVLDALVAPRPGDDLAWIVALSAAIGTVVPEPSEPDEQNPVVVSGHGLVGALSILDAGARGMTPGTISYGQRTAAATAAELALVLRHHLGDA